MAVLKGNAASLKLTTNTVAEMQSWELSVEQEFADTTSFLDTFREQTPTFATWTATAAGKMDQSDTQGQVALQTAWLAGSTVTPRFYIDGTHYYSGSAYVSATVGAAVDGIVEINYSFSGAGTLTYT